MAGVLPIRSRLVGAKIWIVIWSGVQDHLIRREDRGGKARVRTHLQVRSGSLEVGPHGAFPTAATPAPPPTLTHRGVLTFPTPVPEDPNNAAPKSGSTRRSRSLAMKRVLLALERSDDESSAVAFARVIG